MSEFLDKLIEFTAWLTQNAVNLLIQSTVLILLGLLAARMLRQHGSATQSAIYRATLFAVLACPLAAMTLNQLGFNGWTFHLPETTRTVVATQLISSPTASTLDYIDDESRQSTPSAMTLKSANDGTIDPNVEPSLAIPAWTHDVNGNDSNETVRSETNSSAGNANVLAGAAMMPFAFEPQTELVRRTVSNSFWVAIYSVFGCFLLLGTIVLLTRLILAYRKLAVIREMSPVATDSVQSICGQLASRIKVSAPEVRRNSLLSSPCLTGLASPTILLPSEIQDPIPLRKAFAHELAHLRRRDTIWNLIQRMALALFFYQPLMWRLVYRLETTAEEVCDDFVVSHCLDRDGYAQQLVELAESTLIAPNMAGLGMFKSSSSLLHHRVVRILDTTRKLTTQISLPMVAGIVAITLLSATLGGFLGNGSSMIADSSETASLDSESKANEEPITAANEETISLKGQVVDSNGKSIASATVYHKEAEATSDEKGNFQIEVPMPSEDNSYEAILYVDVEGFGRGYCKIDTANPNQHKIELSPDHAVTGTLVDTEGQPIAGAKITLSLIGVLDDVNDFLEKANLTEITFNELPRGTNLVGSHKNEVTSDGDGKFTLNGIGPDRLVHLQIEGPSIALTNAKVLTKQIEPVSVPREAGMFADQYGKITIYGHQPTIVCQPTQVITGVVLDRQSGKPLAGVEIYSGVFSGVPIGGIRDIKSTTDTEGRFELVGMPVGPDNEITAFPPTKGDAAIPYLARDFAVPEGDGINPVEVQIELQRGSWVSGIVTDAKTGTPVANARITYKPYLDNELAVELYSEDDIPTPVGFLESGDDGKWRLVALPGKALVDVWVVKEPFYPPGQGFSEIDAGHKDHLGNIQVIGYPTNMHHPTMMKEIDVVDEAPIENLVYELNPGKSIQVNIVDPAGKPIDDVFVTNASSNLNQNQVFSDSSIEISGFLKDQQRTISMYHKEKKLGLIRTIGYDDESPLTFQLQPNPTVKGKLTDGNGDPIAHAKLRFDIEESKNYFINSIPFAYHTNEKGEFEQLALPGTYNVYAESNDNFFVFARSLELKPGQEFDFGTVDVKATSERLFEEMNAHLSEDQPDEESSDKTEKVDDQEDSNIPTVSYSGRVIDLQGEPVADVEIYRRGGSKDLKAMSTATSQLDGSFTIKIPDSEVAQFSDNRPYVTIRKPGFGVSHVRLEPNNDKQTLTIVNDDHPIEGRLIDPEGNPIVGVQVKVDQLRTFQPGILNDALQLARENDLTLQNLPQGAGTSVEELAVATSDADGKFTISGVGSGRLAFLAITGESTAFRKAVVATSVHGKVNYEDHMSNFLSDGLIHNHQPTLVCEPSQPIEGIVVDRKTKRPLSGFSVTSYGFLNNGNSHFVGQTQLKTTTDAEGRFRLTGMPKGQGNSIIVTAPTTGEFAQPFITQTADVPDAPGIDPIKMEVGLQQGVWIRGKISNLETGDPIVDARVQYMPFDDNEVAASLDRSHQKIMGDYYGSPTDESGSYRFVGIPGPAALGVWVVMDPSYPTGQGWDDIPKERIQEGMIRSSFFQGIDRRACAVAVIEPSGDGLEKNFRLTKGDSVEVIFVDQNDDPVEGVKISFVPSLVGRVIEAKSSSISLDGFLPGQSRKVLFQQPEKKLGAVATITHPTRDISGFNLGVIVAMRPYGTVKLCLKDEDGNPMDGGQVRFQGLFENGSRITGYLPTVPPADENGLVTCELIPGKYALSVDTFSGTPGSRKIEVKPGETLELGDIDASQPGPVEMFRMPTPNSQESSEDSDQQESEQPTVSFSGKVIDLNGNEVADVEITRVIDSKAKTTILATTKLDGSFTIEIPKSELEEFADGMPLVTIQKPGFGKSQVKIDPNDKQQRLTICNDDHPIQGRLIDLEGNPIEGAKVTVEGILSFGQDVLSESLKTAAANEQSLEKLPQGSSKVVDEVEPVFSDAAGKFTIHGIGSGRLTLLTITGESIAIRKAIVVTSTHGNVKYTQDNASFLNDGLIHNHKATLVCEPSLPLEGIVVDRDTNKPLAGFSVTSYRFQHKSGSWSGRNDLKTTTDSEGRFRLTSMPQWAGNAIIVTAPTSSEFDQPFITQIADVPAAHGIESVKMVIELQRGIWIHGKITDKESGQPMANAQLQYMTFDDNQTARSLDDAYQKISHYEHTDESGNYRFVGVPGPAALGVKVSDSRYPPKQGWDEIPKERVQDGKIRSSFFPRHINPFACVISVISPTDEDFAHDFQLTKGNSVLVKLIDMNDDPVDDASFEFSSSYRTEKLESSEVEIAGFLPGRPRHLLFQNEEKKLGAFVTLADSSHDHISGVQPVNTVILKPYGTVRLRLIDKDSNPIANGWIRIERLLDNGDYFMGDRPPRINADEFGLITCELIPGKYSLLFKSDIGTLGREIIEVKPGELLDLGDIDKTKSRPVEMAPQPIPSKPQDANEEQTATSG